MKMPNFASGYHCGVSRESRDSQVAWYSVAVDCAVDAIQNDKDASISERDKFFFIEGESMNTVQATLMTSL